MSIKINFKFFMILDTRDDMIDNRIDVFLSKEFKLSRAFVQKKMHYILINNANPKNSLKIKQGVKIEILPEFFEEPEFDITEIKPYNIPLNIVHEDEDLLVINKQAGLTVHPGAGNQNNTLVNALVYHFTKDGLSSTAGNFRLGIVHRLDKDTSGLMVVAKNNKTHELLSEALQEKTNFTRKYLAICHGFPIPASGIIELFMRKGSFNDGRMMICKELDNGAKYSKTTYLTKEIFCDGLFSMVECQLSTGRTHQIRLHLQNFGNAIVGDKIYNINNPKLTKMSEKIRNIYNDVSRQFLHSYKIEFIHPKSKKLIKLETNLPDDMSNFLKNIS